MKTEPRQKRLADALKKNLLKRKQQQKQRTNALNVPSFLSDYEPEKTESLKNEK